MKKKSLVLLSVILILSFLLAGCVDDKSGTGSKGENEDVVKEEDADEAEEDEEEVLSFYEYADVVYDRKTVEGKFACYFIHSDASMNTYEGNTVNGDSTLLIAPDGTTMLIDCNMTCCASRVVAILQKLGIDKLDYFVNTHPHGDHIGGWSTLLRYIEIEQAYISGSNLYQATGNRYVTGYVDALEKKNIPYDTLYAGDTIEFGGAQIEVLWPAPDTDWDTCEPTDALQNDYSIVMKVTYKDSTFLFGGDIERATESKLVDQYGEKLQADIVKMNHHGYSSSETDKWLDAVQSKLAVALFYSAHTEESMYKYVMRDSIPLYTGIDKTCLVYTDGDGTYDVQVEKERTFYDYLLPEMSNGHFRVE